MKLVLKAILHQNLNNRTTKIRKTVMDEEKKSADQFKVSI